MARRLHALCALFVACGGALLLPACGTDTDPLPEATPATEAVDVPDAIITVRDAAADYLREAAAICAPPEGAIWRTDSADPALTPGAMVFRFASGDCVLTVAGPDPLPEEAQLYVAYRNEASAFCWQALIDVEGEIRATGYEQTVPGLENPAETYCEAQGQQFELITKEDGSPCAACVLEDGTTCNAWAYFYGECGPNP